MIVVEKLAKRFGSHAVLSDVGFEAHAGEITLLIGPNGAGKSTTMRLLAGLSVPDSGTLRISGIDAREGGVAYRSRLSFLPQNPAFHPRFTARRILNFYARLRGVSLGRVDEVLAAAGLLNDCEKPSGILSGGLRQRLGIALLLLPDAPVLLLDEPGLSLDPEWRERLLAILRAEALAGKTVLVATHLLGEWNGKAGRCLLCMDGGVLGGVDPENLSYRTLAKEPPKRDRGTANPHPAQPPARLSTSLFAVLAREIQAAVKNRYLQFFAALALVGGLIGAWIGETLESIAHYNLQVALYSVPLFALLFGVSGARMEAEEWPMLFSQPVARPLIPLGKFLAGLAAFGALLGLVFGPGIFVGAPAGATLSLYAASMGLASVFTALGLLVGFLSDDRVRALVAGVVVWLGLFAGFDLAAAALAHVPFVSGSPGLWIAALMLNPVDSFRVHGLFALERIPPETAAKAPVADFWLNHSGACFALVAVLWTVFFLAATVRRLRVMYL